MKTTIRTLLHAGASTLMLAAAAFAQAAPEVLHQDDFQSYGTQANPPGWVDTSVGLSKPEAKGIYKTWPDPLAANNIVFGTKQASGKPDGNHPRIGTFSTLSDKTFAGDGRFEYRGRMLRTNADSRIGLTFFSSYPEQDRYYLVGLWSRPGGNGLTMQLFAFGGGALVGTLDSGFTPEPNVWYRFAIHADDVDGKTNLRARFWPDGAPEPESFQIVATDSSASRLTFGRIGIWAAVKGDAYVDDLWAKSPVDHTPPVIEFYESNDPIEEGEGFNRDITPEIRITDDLSTFTFTATLDGAPYAAGTQITAEGTHALAVTATDAVGNSSNASVSFFIDKTPPALQLLAGGQPIAEGRMFAADVVPETVVTDASPTTVVVTVDGATLPPGAAIAAEGSHSISATATDAVGWTTTAGPFSILLDKTAPVVEVTFEGQPIGAAYNRDVVPQISISDLTATTTDATLNGAPYSFGTPITTEGVQHVLAVSVTDAVGWTTTLDPIRFTIDKTKPEVTALANGMPFPASRIFAVDVAITLDISDTSGTSSSATLNGQPYTLGTLITTESTTHTFAATVQDALGWTVDVGPIVFTIDKTPPAVTVTESGAPLVSGAIFGREVTPVLTVEDLTTTTSALTLDGAPFVSGTPVGGEGDHTLAGTVTDAAGNATTIEPIAFTIDLTPPDVEILESGAPLAEDTWFNRDVIPALAIDDLTATTTAATLNGEPFTVGGSIVAEGTYTFAATVTDAVGLATSVGPVTFHIDKTAPALAFVEYGDGDVVATPRIAVAGAADDAVTVTVNGSAANVDLDQKSFLSNEIELLEGSNTIAASGTDRAGNVGTAVLRLVVDTRGPEIAVSVPPAGACVDSAILQVSGTVVDPHVDSVTVKAGAASVTVPVDPASGAWSAAISDLPEGQTLITIEAADSVGHLVSSSRTIVIDRTAPVLQIHEGGAPFTATLVNRPVAFFLRAVDTDPNVVVAATLDGSPYATGASIEGEGAHVLVVSANDCAGHSAQQTVEFTIDRMPPAIRNLDPAHASTVGTMPDSIRGTTDPDAASVSIVGSALTATPAADGTFVLAGAPFVEGVNRFTLRATDHAGNSASTAYQVEVRTAAPVVEIRESGLPIAPGALYDRAVTPTVRSVDLEATVAATLNGAPFLPGTSITADGDYTLRATATDALGHEGTAEATFAIDRTSPVVAITSPAAGPVEGDTIAVHGNAGDAVSAAVNGQPVALGADGSFTLDALLLEIGPNPIVAIGRDRAGNTGRAEIVVTRDDIGAGIILTYPPDRSLTNRPTTEVVGRLLSPNRETTVTVGSHTVTVDPTGAFRVTGYELTEGENTITAVATARNGVQSSAAARVTADFTPPSLTILESDQPLVDGARFATEALVSLQASDAGGGAVTTELRVDGTRTTASPHTIAVQGGHALVATARDLAGNEARSEKTLFIGLAGGSASCGLSGFDPADGSVILRNVTELVGRTGGAIGVKVNGVPAIVADGSFCATVELPAEGPNTVTIVCTDGEGNATGEPATITLHRVTGDPSISIDSPAEGFVSATDSIAVSGTVGPGVVSADVNGVPATISGTDTNVARPFTVPAVHLASGLNVLVAHGRNAAGRIATASRRGIQLKNAPSIQITSPGSTTTTGFPEITLGGTYGSLDPATLTVTNLATGGSSAVSSTRWSDTTGAFAAVGVPLTAGEQTLRVSGRDRLNREASATVTVILTAGAPAISIASPLDQTVFGPGSDTFAVSGTFQGAAGSSVDVNGSPANVSGSTFAATATFTELAGSATPVVARVTEPGGANASTLIAVTRLTAAPSVIESFPAPGAIEVDGGALLLVLFSQPMDRATLDGAFRLESSDGSPVSGTFYLDRDVLTFAPATILTPGGLYTMRVTTAAANIAGTPLSPEYGASFTVATSAPSTPPAVDPMTSAVCGEEITVTGTAAPGARVRLESGTLTLNSAADVGGRFAFTYPISGQSGFTVVRVRVVGSDGSVSPAAELKLRVDCSGPQVVSATFDRATNQIAIHFSEAVDPSSALMGAGGSILLTAATDGRLVGGSASVSGNLAVVTPAEDLTADSFSLSVTTEIRDLLGNRLVAPYSQEFPVGGDQPVSGDGSGFISGEVYDATTGRPLPGVAITIALPTGATYSTTTDARGRYLARLPEGAHTIAASTEGHASVWRQIIVPAGAGVVPIDIRLTRRGSPAVSAGAPLALTHGGDTAVTRRADLAIPGGVVITGAEVTLTSIGGQALTGLLPLGWAPLASAEVLVDGDADAALSGASLTFHLPADEIQAAAQNVAAVRYDAARDEWRVVASVLSVGSDGAAPLPISTAGAYAVVYGDDAPGLAVAPLPVSGDVLRGVPAAQPDAPPLVPRDFVLDPPIVLPTGRTVATLRIEAADASFPSGTAVQAYIDEELHLADGSRLLDPPFATDLLLYRTLTGDLAAADFHLAPSGRAAEVILEIGYDHIRILPYPGRLDRGTLIGSEGGRVPADEKVEVEIPSGAVPEPVRATATALNSEDLASFGAIPGFRIVGGFQLTLQRATEPAPQDLDEDGVPDAVAPVELFVPARATFAVTAADLPSPDAQVILAELLDQTPYGQMIRLANRMTRVDLSSIGAEAVRFTTSAIDRAVLPVDGVAHEGRYLVLAADAPIAFATGTVRLGAADGRLLEDARVSAPPLGVADLTRAGGIYNVAIPAAPAAPFTLLPRHTSTGDGVPYAHATAPDAASVVRVDLALVAQPPVLESVVVLKGDPPSQAALTAGTTTTDVALTTNARASFSPAIDPASVTPESIVVTNATSGARVNGSAAADGTLAVVWTLAAGERLQPNARYTVGISGEIRGTSGAALGAGASYAIATVREVLSTEVRRERIRISIPDESGVSKIWGDPGALPAGWQAVAVRRGRDFVVQYQATAAGDGSFAFFIGDGGDPADRVGLGDRIDLQIISNVGNLTAIFELTPFVSEDGLSFVVPAGAAVRYTTPDGITLDVPAGAFDEPTVVEVKTSPMDVFLDIPRFEEENDFAAAVHVEFDGVANLPLDVEVPVPAGYDTTGKEFILAWKGDSVRGPRLAVADIMRVVDGKFTTVPDEATSSQTFTVYKNAPGAQATLTGKQFRDYCIRLQRGGYYTVLDIRQPIGTPGAWAAIDGIGASYELTWDIYWSYYTPYMHVFERAGHIIPVLADTPFTVWGTDRTTGLQSFTRTYDPLPAGPPFSAQPIPSPLQNDGGPYPIFGTPFRVETLDLDVEDLDIETIRNFRVRLSNGNVTVSPGADPLDSSLKVELLNVSSGTAISGTAGSQLTLEAWVGDRIVLLIEERDVDSRSAVSVVFNEPIYTGGDSDPDVVDAVLHQLVTVEQGQTPASGGNLSYTDISYLVRFTMDSGNRRLNVELPSALQSEAVYRVTLSGAIADIETTGPGLVLGQGTYDDGSGILTPVGGGQDLSLLFRVRKPAGHLRSFSAADTGLIRGIDLYGNVLFVAAMNGGLRAFDMSDAAATGSGDLLAEFPGPPDNAFEHHAVTVDRHGRVVTIAHLPILGVLRSYRVEDFVAGVNLPPAKASTIINWRLGYSSSIGLASNTILSDRPESIPFRVKLVLQDDEKTFENIEEFKAMTGATVVQEFPSDDLYRLSVSFGKQSDYNYERITVENLTLDMRWSADASPGGGASFDEILARSTDRIRVARNKRTYAVVAHLGFGVGVYDLNAAESNRYPGASPALREQIFLGNGIMERWCDQPETWAIGESYLNTDAEIHGDSEGNLHVYGIDTNRGILDYQINPGVSGDPCKERSRNGLIFRSHIPGSEEPTIAALRSAIEAAGGSTISRFMTADRISWSVTAEENAAGLRGTQPEQPARRDYVVVAGFDYGLIVVEIDSDQGGTYFPLLDDHIADVIWIPSGAAGVRVIQSANVAVVNDRYGRVILVDLSRIDERAETPPGALFPTAAAALQGPATDPYGVGSDDPRILWKSEPGMTSGTHPPVFDPVTGMVYGAHGTDRTMKVVSAVDPAIRFKVNLGEPEGMGEVGGIVPLGIAPPKEIEDRIEALSCTPGPMQCKQNASLAAFRIEVALPGRMLESLNFSGNELRLAVESERIAGALTEQTPDGFPRAHLRRSLRNGDSEISGRAATNFTFRRIVPDQFAATMRHQRGFNRFISPWIVAIADPRASRDYDWQGATAEQKEEAGCFSCERPEHLENLGEADGVYELFTNGRFITVRPELLGSDLTIFDGTPYEYLGEGDRLLGRISTIMADTVRPTEVLSPGQNPPVEAGLVQETLFLHSGEVETATADLFAGGRGDSGVLIDRTYRSRTIGNSPFGAGWDSALFRRLRALPNGDVEYRDGAELWLFRFDEATASYESPEGFFYNLARTASGWKLIDQQWRVIEFDDLGRILSEADEFYHPQIPDSGNIVRYVYDASGRLSKIVDPVRRVTTLQYWEESAGGAGAYPGLVKQIEDWRDRTIDYEYDPTTATLLKARLPEFANTSGGRPFVEYGYAPASSSFTDKLELRTNLESIRDPHEAVAGGPARVRFTYATGSGFQRDRMVSQQWATGENATFTYASPTSVATTDALGQKRQYELSVQPDGDRHADRAHILTMTEESVRTSSSGFGELPANVTPGVPATASPNRTFTFQYDDHGQVTTATLAGVRSTTFSYIDVRPEAPGFVLGGANTTALGGAAAPINEALSYQSGANLSTFLSSVSANGQTFETPEPSRNALDLSSTNDAIQSSEQYDSAGLPTAVTSAGGTDSGSGGAATTMTWADAAAPEHERGLPTSIQEGDLETTIAYPTRDQMVETHPRGVVGTTDYDSWERPVRVSVTGPQISSQEQYEYDASGRLRRHRRLQGSITVTSTFQYDAMGRQTSATMDNVADAGTVTTTTSYNISGRTIVTTHPGGATTTVTLDGLGRTASRVTSTGGSPITDHFAYDLDGNLVFESDLQVAAAYAWDAHGRMTGTVDSDGIRAVATLDAFGMPVSLERFDASGAPLGQTTFERTDQGRVESFTTQVDGSQTRTTRFAWDGGGRTTGIGTEGRSLRSSFDTSGRLVSSASGAGTAQGVTTAFNSTTISGHTGRLPQNVEKGEKTGGAYQLALEYNALGDVITERLGSLDWNRTFDQAGNVTAAAAPARASATLEYDSRGAVARQTLPDGATNSYQYHPSGGLAGYSDPTDEVTSTTTDLIGRPIARSYTDGTQETIVWEGRRAQSITDRQGRTQTFNYNAKGQIGQISTAGEGAPAILETIDYDGAGRITRWATPDSAIEYSDFDFEGRPRKTVQERYRGGSLVDRYEQQHTYNVHGERTGFTMPSYSGFSSVNPWTVSVTQERDEAGNLVRMERALSGSGGASTLVESEFRNAGRPDRRTVTTIAGEQIARNYGYDSTTGLPIRMEVLSTGEVVGGSAVTFDGLQKSSAQLLGVSGGARSNLWGYDARGRLSSSVLGGESSSTPESSDLTASDFRVAFERRPETPVDPPAIHFTEDPAGHKIASVQRGTVTEQFVFDGAERVEDGGFHYEYDAKGRLAVVTEKVPPGSIVPPRRVLYFYDGNDRVVARRAEFAPVDPGTVPQPGDWILENREFVLRGDGLPAEATFVWDPIDDRLVAIYKSGASQNPSIDGNGGLVRQILHGEAKYDDPLEVAVADSDGDGVSRLYPVYDEAGAGSLDLIINETGRIVSRSAPGGPFGEDPSVIEGAAVDRVSVSGESDAEGNVLRVVVSLRSTEAIAEDSVAAGLRLAIVDETGAVVRTFDGPASLENGALASWTLTAGEWEALVDPAPVMTGGVELTPVALSVAVTSSARAHAWSETQPFLRAPAWAVASKPVYASDALPVEVRESLANLSQWLASLGPEATVQRTLYEVPTLGALGAARAFGGGFTPETPAAESLLIAASFHAHPFQDPFTGKNFVRARWFDPRTGAWLTPDPRGYADSPNLYAYCANDPVNLEDPTGEWFGLVVDLGFIVWDTYQYARGNISGAEYAGRMALNAASVLANAATGGGGLALRAARMGGRAGQVVRGTLRAAQAVNRAENAVNAANAAVSAVDAVANGENGRLALSVVQVVLGARGARGAGGGAARPDLAADAASAAATRARVLENIAASQAARRSSRFSQHATFDRLYREAGNVDVSSRYGGAVFYSGRGGLNRQRAEAFAGATGRTTLEMTSGGSRFDAMKLYDAAISPLSRSQADAIWGRLSQRFAHASRGPAHAFTLGSRPNSIFNTVELPELRARGARIIYRGFEP